jgi:hypothetical protein
METWTVIDGGIDLKINASLKFLKLNVHEFLIRVETHEGILLQQLLKQINLSF